MAIVNVTPDSFSDGTPGATTRDAVARCERAVADGADLVDVGGESTRPGAAPVPADVELARVMPVLREAVGLGVAVSIDTTKPEVMRAALDAGADVVNDVRALREPGALGAVAAHPTCGVCLMHMPGTPQTMQRLAAYGDVVADVRAFLRERVAACSAGGIASDRIVVDPGIGFGKTPAHNLALLDRQRELLDVGAPLLVGWSRKSTLARMLGVSSGADASNDDRQQLVAASVAAAVLAVERGAAIVRVHDVAATVAALAVSKAVRSSAG